MNKEDIIRMAREAWGEGKEYCFTGPEHWHEVEDMFQRFAALVAAAEREACAKACDEVGNQDSDNHAWDAAAAIRARSEE